MLKDKTIIFISSFWDELWTRKQRLALRLSENNKVLYVNPVFTVLTPFKDRWFFGKIVDWYKGLRRINGNLHVLTLPPLLPFHTKSYYVNVINYWITSLLIKRTLKKLSLRGDLLLWIYPPRAVFLARFLKTGTIVYDCVDEHSAYPAEKKEIIEKVESELVKRSDMVFATSEQLCERIKSSNPNTFFAPNGVDFEHFNKAVHHETPVPPELLGKDEPVIVLYVGAIQKWVDLELVEHIAKERKGWRILMVGPVAVDVGRLSKHDNVVFTGRKDLVSLPSYLKASSVCIIPFKVNKLTSRVNPLKLYEYWAAGKPVVSTYMPEVARFQSTGLVRISRGKEDFLIGIEESIKSDSRILKQERIVTAQKYSWDVIFSEMEAKVSTRV